MPIFNKTKFIEEYEHRLLASILSYNKIINPTERDKEKFNQEESRIYQNMLSEHNLKIHSDEIDIETYNKIKEIRERLLKQIKPAN